MTKPTKWHLRPAKTQISLGISPVWSESSLSVWRKLGSLATHWVHSEDSDQTGWMPRLIWVFAGRTLTLLVLLRGGSFLLAYTYRPPSSTQGWTADFEQVLEKLYTENMEIILIGDININLLDNSSSVRNWLQIIDSVNLIQLVETPTRVTATSSTPIDHAYSNRAENIVDIYVPCYAISDHYPICLTRKLSQCKASKQGHKTITYRAKKMFDQEQFL